MKWLALFVLLPVLLGFGLAFHPQPSEFSAAGIRTLPSDEPAGKPPSGQPVFRQAAHENPEASAQGVNALLEAAVAFRCGNRLQEEAKRHSGETARILRELAAQQFQSCLAHEGQAAATLSLFADARRTLDQAKALLADQAAKSEAAPPEKPRPEMLPKPRADSDTPPAESPKAVKPPAAPAEKSPPPVVQTPKKGRANPLMVGPDGVIYERRQ